MAGKLLIVWIRNLLMFNILLIMVVRAGLNWEEVWARVLSKSNQLSQSRRIIFKNMH